MSLMCVQYKFWDLIHLYYIYNVFWLGKAFNSTLNLPKCDKRFTLKYERKLHLNIFRIIGENSYF